MKLYSSEPSAYSRKVRILIAELGLTDRVEIHDQRPRDGSSGFFDLNPLARIPVLQTDDGVTLYDSPVICEYLDVLAQGDFIAREGPRRWDTLRRQALGDGILDWALQLRGELMRPAAKQSEDLISRCDAAIGRGLDAAQGERALVSGDLFDLGAIAVGCAIGWLELRLAERAVLATRPVLAQWYDRLMQRPSFHSTTARLAA